MNYFVVVVVVVVVVSGEPRNFVRGVQHIQLRTEGRENGDLGAVAPYSGVPLNLQMSETRILIRLLRMYFPRNWNSAQLFQNFGISVGSLNPLNHPSVRRWLLLMMMIMMMMMKRFVRIH
jgi:hypothetical protein